MPLPCRCGNDRHQPHVLECIERAKKQNTVPDRARTPNKRLLSHVIGGAHVLLLLLAPGVLSLLSLYTQAANFSI